MSFWLLSRLHPPILLPVAVAIFGSSRMRATYLATCPVSSLSRSEPIRKTRSSDARISGEFPLDRRWLVLSCVMAAVDWSRCGRTIHCMPQSATEWDTILALLLSSIVHTYLTAPVGRLSFGCEVPEQKSVMQGRGWGSGYPPCSPALQLWAPSINISCTPLCKRFS